MREHDTSRTGAAPGRLPDRARGRRLLAGVAALAATAPLAAVAVTPTATAAEDAELLGPWEWQNPLPQGNDLFGVALSETMAGVTVGDGGTLLRTTDGGDSWQGRGADWPYEQGGVAEQLTEVAVAGPLTVMAVGSAGTVLRSTDGGKAWSFQDVPDAVGNLQGVDFVDANTGVAVGSEEGSGRGVILRTTDGGTTWVDQTANLVTELDDFTAVHCSDAQTCTAVESGGLFLARTTNGGQSWDTMATPGPGVPRIADVFFTSTGTGVIVGRSSSQGMVWRTTDGGVSWMATAAVPDANFAAVTFADAENGWAVGANGAVAHTTNGGVSWQPQDSTTTASLQDVAFATPTTGTAVGRGGVIVHTVDGGESWSMEWDSATTADLGAVSFPVPETGWAAGRGGTILHTDTGGASWGHQDSGTTAVLNDIEFASPSSGWAVGSGGTIVHTSNGGSSWEPQTSGVTTFLESVSCPTVDVCTTVGSGQILRSEDGGVSWDSKYEFVGTLRGVHFRDRNVGFAVGRHVVDFEGLPLVLRTTDGGGSWQDVSPLPDSNGTFEDVAFVDADTWVVVGDVATGSLLRTTDGGDTWTNQAPPAAGSLTDVSFFDATTGIAVGDAGAVLRTTDGGQTWAIEPRRTNRHLTGVAVTGPETATAVGDAGSILRRSADDGGGGDPGDPGDPPEPSEGSQDIVATVPETPGEGSLVLSVDPNDRTVTLPEMADAGDRLATSGALRPVTVTDSRAAANPGWDASAQVSDFANAADVSVTFDGGYLGWIPQVGSQSSGQTVTAGAAVDPGFPNPDEAGLSIPQTFASAAAGQGVGTAMLGAGLALELPTDTLPGTYTAVLTLTAI